MNDEYDDQGLVIGRDGFGERKDECAEDSRKSIGEECIVTT